MKTEQGFVVTIPVVLVAVAGMEVAAVTRTHFDGGAVLAILIPQLTLVVITWLNNRSLRRTSQKVTEVHAQTTPPANVNPADGFPPSAYSPIVEAVGAVIRAHENDDQAHRPSPYRGGPTR